MKVLIFIFSFSAFASLEIKTSFIENPFALPSDIDSFNVENIARDTEAIELDYLKKLKKRSLLGFSIKNKLSLGAIFYNTDLLENKSAYNLKNRDNVNDGIKELSLSISSLAYKKIARKTVFFVDFTLEYKDGYSLEYDVFPVGFKTFDYYLFSTENVNLKLISGIQSKLSNKIRLDASYAFSVSDYFYDYSIYELNQGQQEDNISHSLNSTFNIKSTKRFDIDIKTFASYKIYRNKLALRENGYILTQGTARAEELFDISQAAAFNFKVYKSLRSSFDIGKFIRKDQVSGARDVEIDSYKFEVLFEHLISINASFEYKDFDYKNQIASLSSELLTDLRQKNSRELKIGASFENISLNITNININSTREYDTINHNRYDLSFKTAF